LVRPSRTGRTHHSSFSWPVHEDCSHRCNEAIDEHQADDNRCDQVEHHRAALKVTECPWSSTFR